MLDKLELAYLKMETIAHILTCNDFRLAKYHHAMSALLLSSVTLSDCKLDSLGWNSVQCSYQSAKPSSNPIPTSFSNQRRGKPLCD